jgi:hypothetical protein
MIIIALKGVRDQALPAGRQGSGVREFREFVFVIAFINMSHVFTVYDVSFMSDCYYSLRPEPGPCPLTLDPAFILRSYRFL